MNKGRGSNRENRGVDHPGKHKNYYNTFFKKVKSQFNINVVDVWDMG